MNLKRFLITSCLQYSCTVVSKEVAFTRRTLVLSVRQEVSAMEVSPECCKSFMLRSRFSQSPQKWSQDSLAGLISISLCQIPSVTCMAPAAPLVFGWQCKDTIIVNKTSRTKFLSWLHRFTTEAWRERVLQGVCYIWKGVFSLKVENIKSTLKNLSCILIMLTCPI